MVKKIGAIFVGLAARDARIVLTRPIDAPGDVQTRVFRERAAVVNIFATQGIETRDTRAVDTHRYLTRCGRGLWTLCVGEAARGVGDDHALIVVARALCAVWNGWDDGLTISGVGATALGHGCVHAIRLHTRGREARTTILAKRKVFWYAASWVCAVDQVETRAADTRVDGALVVVV